MNPVLTVGLVATSLALTAVSITCEIALFTGFAQTELDQQIAAVTGAGLVASQFLLVGVFQEHLHQKRWALATGVFLLITLLLGISVAGTAAWLETRYQEQHQVSLKSTQEHQLVTQLLEDFGNQANSLRKQAVLDRKTGNHWRAGERLKEAAQADEQRIKALAMLKNIKSVPQNSGQSLASENNALRWGLWVILAVLIDLCPLLGFASIRNPKALPVKTPSQPAISAEVPEVSAVTPLSVKTPATLKSANRDNAPAKSDSAASNAINSVTIQNTSLNNTATKPTLICCHDIADHQRLLQEEISAGVYPEGPTIRALMKRHHVGYKKAKVIYGSYKKGCVKKAS